MSDYKIRINTEGAKQAAADLRALAIAAAELQNRIAASTNSASGKSAADSASVFSQQRIRENVTKDQAAYLGALTDEAKETADLTKKTDLLSGAKVNLTKAFKSLSHEIPIVGQLLSFLKNPYFAAIALIAGFIAAIKKQVDAQNELARASAETATSLDPSIVRMTTLKTLAAEAAVSHQEFATSIAAIANSMPKALAALDDLNTRLTRRRDLAQEIETAEKKRQLAEVELGVAQGSISPIQAIERRFAIEGKFDDASRKRKEDAIGVQANIERQKEFQNKQRVVEAREAEPGAAAAVQAEKDRLKKMDDDNAANEALRQKRLVEIQKQKAELEFKKATSDSIPAGPYITSIRQEREKAYEGLTSEEIGIGRSRDAFGASRTLQAGRVSAAEGELNRIRGVATTAETARLSSQHAANQGVEAYSDQHVADAIIKAKEDAARSADRQVKLFEEWRRQAEEASRRIEKELERAISFQRRRTNGDGG